MKPIVKSIPLSIHFNLTAQLLPAARLLGSIINCKHNHKNLPSTCNFGCHIKVKLANATLFVTLNFRLVKLHPLNRPSLKIEKNPEKNSLHFLEFFLNFLMLPSKITQTFLMGRDKYIQWVKTVRILEKYWVLMPYLFLRETLWYFLFSSPPSSCFLS